MQIYLNVYIYPYIHRTDFDFDSEYDFDSGSGSDCMALTEIHKWNQRNNQIKQGEDASSWNY